MRKGPCIHTHAHKERMRPQHRVKASHCCPLPQAPLFQLELRRSL